MGNEGGFVDNQQDPGGATRYGITQRTAALHGYTGPMQDLPLDTAKTIARAEYWDPIHCDELPDPLDFQVFDACYNSGQGRTFAWLEDACKIPRGSLSSPTAQVNLVLISDKSDSEIDRVIMRFDAKRLLFLDASPNWPSFSKGWARRIAENLLRAAG